MCSAFILEMRQHDDAHSLKLYIAHNDAILGGEAIPGRGSAIFLHIWRDDGERRIVKNDFRHRKCEDIVVIRFDSFLRRIHD